MKIDRLQLVEVLATIRPGLAKKEIVEHSTHFIFTGTTLLTYNDYISVHYPFETDFTCSVPAEEFYKVLTTLQDAELDLTFKEGRIRLKGKRTSSGLATGTGESILDRVDKLSLDAAIKKMKSLPGDFVEGLRLCLFSVSKDMSHPVLTGILVDDDALLSTDDIRISQYVLEKPMGVTINLPGAAAEELVNFPEPTKFHATKNWAYFKGKNNVVFCARLIGSEGFPDMDGFFKFKGVKIQFPETFQEAVQKALIMAHGEIDKDKMVDVIVEGKAVQVRGEKEIGWLQTEVDLEAEVKGRVAFSINPHFLIRILSHTRQMVYANDRAMFQDKNFSHLLSLQGEEE